MILFFFQGKHNFEKIKKLNILFKTLQKN